MAQPTNVYDLINQDDNVREGISKMVSNISPTDVAFLEAISGPEETAQQKEYDWIDDADPPPADTAAVDGDLFVPNPVTKGTRFRNYLQIQKYGVSISRRAQQSDTVGGLGKLKKELRKYGRAARNSVNLTIQKNKIARVEDANTENQKYHAAGFPSYIETNLSLGAGGAAPADTNGLPTTASVQGTARKLSFTGLKRMIKECWEMGGDPSCVVMPAETMEAFTKFLYTNQDAAQIAQQFQDQGKKPTGPSTVVSSIKIVITAFGAFEFLMDRHIPDNQIYIIQKNKLSMCYYKGGKYWMSKMGMRGDMYETLLLVDFCLMVRSQKAHAVITANNPALAITD